VNRQEQPGSAHETEPNAAITFTAQASADPLKQNLHFGGVKVATWSSCLFADEERVFYSKARLSASGGLTSLFIPDVGIVRCQARCDSTNAMSSSAWRMVPRFSSRGRCCWLDLAREATPF